MRQNKKTRSKGIALVLAIVLPLGLAGCSEKRFQAPLAVDFDLPALDGSGNVTLSEFRGDVVYLSFWASWCIPCRTEMPHLQELWQQYRDDGFQVIGINVDDDPQKAIDFAAEHGIEFPLVSDESRAVSRQYRVAGYPTHYIVGRDGRVHFSALGFTQDDAVAVTVEVQTLLRGSADGAD
ncbi:MAG: TlpA disulfide reductase family protein [Halioglobus sp.]